MSTNGIITGGTCSSTSSSTIKSEPSDDGPTPPTTPLPYLDPAEYDRLEFTHTTKLALISLLNGAMPELEPLESLEENILSVYWRLGALVNFFNMMFEVGDVLYLSELPSMSSTPRHMTEGKMINVNRYIRFWLTQFYDCDEVIETLRFSPDQISMTTILILNLFYSVRHSLPQLRALFTAHWSPALDDFASRLRPVLRFDQISHILQYQLENERVNHQETKRAKKMLSHEVEDLRESLEKSRSTVAKLKSLLESAKREHQVAMEMKPQTMSLLNNVASGSGTITISNSVSKTNSLISSGQFMPRRRGRPRKNPIPTISHASTTTTLRTIKPAPMTLNTKPIVTTLSPQQPLVIPPPSFSTSQSRTILSTGPGPSSMVMGPTMLVQHHQQQSILTPMSYGDKQPMTLLKKPTPIRPSPPPTINHHQLILTPNQVVSINATPIVSLAPAPITYLSPPSLIVQQPQPLITLQQVSPSLIATQSTSGPSLLIKTDHHHHTSPMTSPALISPVSGGGGSGSASDGSAANQYSKSSTYYSTKYPNSRTVDPKTIEQYYITKAGSAITKCRLCSRRFPDFDTFEVHFTQHINKRLYYCDWPGCTSFFLSNYKMNRHKRSHTGERPYVCGRCQKRFSRNDKLKDHQKQCFMAEDGTSSGASTSGDGSTMNGLKRMNVTEAFEVKLEQQTEEEEEEEAVIQEEDAEDSETRAEWTASYRDDGRLSVFEDDEQEEEARVEEEQALDGPEVEEVEFEEDEDEYASAPEVIEEDDVQLEPNNRPNNRMSLIGTYRRGGDKMDVKRMNEEDPFPSEMRTIPLDNEDEEEEEEVEEGGKFLTTLDLENYNRDLEEEDP